MQFRPQKSVFDIGPETYWTTGITIHSWKHMVLYIFWSFCTESNLLAVFNQFQFENFTLFSFPSSLLNRSAFSCRVIFFWEFYCKLIQNNFFVFASNTALGQDDLRNDGIMSQCYKVCLARLTEYPLLFHQQDGLTHVVDSHGMILKKHGTKGPL